MLFNAEVLDSSVTLIGKLYWKIGGLRYLCVLQLDFSSPDNSPRPYPRIIKDTYWPKYYPKERWRVNIMSE